MSIKNFLSLLLLVCNVHALGQNKQSLDPCSLWNSRASVIAFKIPDERCSLNTAKEKRLQGEIERNIETQANIVQVSSCAIGRFDIAEVLFSTTNCDTVAMLAIKRRANEFYFSKPYKIVNTGQDFRVSITKHGFILYRKIIVKGKVVTASFEFDKNSRRLDGFLDDGLSIW